MLIALERFFKARPFLLCLLCLLVGRCSAHVIRTRETTATLSDSDIEVILNTHNSARGNVNPPASNMKALVSYVCNNQDIAPLLMAIFICSSNDLSRESILPVDGTCVL